jgi:hypothetical protein
MKALDPIKVFADGRTSPEVKSGTAILLIQDGTVQVGKLNLDECYDFNIEIDHPINQTKLDTIATKLVESEKPEYLNSESSLIILCPQIISDAMNWD